MPEWTNFSMTPVHPMQGLNPVTRVLNMVAIGDGAVGKRQDFDSLTSPGSDPSSSVAYNHILFRQQGGSTAYLLVKAGTKLYSSSGGGFTALGSGSREAPVGTVQSGERGSFALHGMDAYYCDSGTIQRIERDLTAVKPGVVSLEGQDYNVSVADGGLGLSTNDDNYFTTAPAPWISGGDDLSDPLQVNPAMEPSYNDPNISPVRVGKDGEKTLNTGFAFSWYDPVRKIFGRRCEVFAYPYVFGPADPTGGSILSDQRFQYAKIVQVPSAPVDNTHYEVAIWFTLGQRVITNEKATVEDFPFIYFNERFPAMSKRMTSVVFLESIVTAGTTNVRCTKDDAALVQSGRYIDTYSRPLPSQFMIILDNGTAIYFFPWISESDAGATLTSYAEFSVRHPEQVGRDTENQRDTVSELPNLVGNPVAVLNHGGRQLMLTNNGPYQIGFSSKVQLHPLAPGKGLVGNGNSIAAGSVGILWMAPDGVAWLRGGSLANLTERLPGFGRWFTDLTYAQKQSVAIGISEATHQVLVFVDDIDDSGQRCLVFDWERDFVSEFKDFGGTAGYCADFPQSAAHELWCFGAGKYPSTSKGSYECKIDLWINEQPETVKRLKSVVVDAGPRTAAFTVTVEGHDHGSTADNTAPSSNNSRSKSVAVSGDGSGRYKLVEPFMGMRGRLFKITISHEAGGEFSIQRVIADYEAETSDARSA